MYFPTILKHKVCTLSIDKNPENAWTYRRSKSMSGEKLFVSLLLSLNSSWPDGNEQYAYPIKKAKIKGMSAISKNIPIYFFAEISGLQSFNYMLSNS